MKVLLVNPPLRSANAAEPLAFPLGLGYLAAALRQAGHSPLLLDACLGPARRLPDSSYFHLGLTTPEILDRIAEIGPDLVGISIPFTSRAQAAIEIGRAIRAAFPDLTVVGGGMHATVAPQELLTAGFHEVLLGEAEWSFPEYLQGAGRGTARIPVDGSAYLDHDEVQLVPQTRHPVDLDCLTFPARDLLPFEQYLRRSGGRWIYRGARMASMITSRGCPYHCTFCSAFRLVGRKYRRRSAPNVLAEIEELVQRYGVSVIAFEDDNLTADRERARQIFEGIARRFPRLKWITPNGISINHLDRELLQLMKKSGCRSVNLAFESGDPDILHRVMKKDVDPEAGRRVRQWCKEAGIAVNGYFILGMPGETPASLQRTREFALSLDLEGIGIFIATPFPGTELYDYCVEKGYLEEAYLRGEISFGSDPEVLHRPLIETPMLKRTELLAYYDEFQRDFYRRYYARRPLRRLRSLGGRLLRGLGAGK